MDFSGTYLLSMPPFSKPFSAEQEELNEIKKKYVADEFMTQLPYVTIVKHNYPSRPVLTLLSLRHLEEE
ncbi:CLUMA_CG011417, isoform A [Clunio marinus]|uniref:CLUMA_CG011417, isoform A n=1 Tax=Clunio marinus TaxID=568069 RepID=A0A1J1ICT3_9DIPT|nr:CLUMA_CG011417, isoform A [Clunio marinus]